MGKKGQSQWRRIQRKMIKDMGAEKMSDIIKRKLKNKQIKNDK